MYINHNNLWEEYVRDGKKGDTPRWSPSGGGLGERDVKKVTGQLGIFTSQEEANSFVANNPDMVRVGSSATIAGVPSVYQGPGAGWVAQSLCASRIIYNGTTIPLPAATVGNAGMRILVVNPAVPRGFSRLESTGTIWAPPAGELIAGIWRGLSPVALVTPGVTTQVLIWQSEIIPEYMIPDLIVMEVRGGITARNAAGVSGCTLGLGISSSSAATLALGGMWTPNVSGVGIGNRGSYPDATIIHCADVTRRNDLSGFMSPVNSGTFPGNTCGIASAGNNRAMAVAKPSSVTDQIQFDGIRITAKGTL